MKFLQIAMFGAIALEVVFVPLFLKIEWPNRTYRSLACKQICSALFLIVGLCAIFYAKNDSAYAWLVLSALLSSFIGDALLHYEAIVKKEAFFLYGMIAFAAAHILYLAAYCVAFGRLFPDQPPVAWHEPLLLIVILVGGHFTMKCLKLDTGKLKIPMFFYTAILVAMVIHACHLALACMRAGLPLRFSILLLLGGGALLFAVSDGTLAFLHFGDPKKYSLRCLNIATYYAAQCMLAATILCFPV
uniref:lysoplasmalogenase n=1 Tax=Candidatus Fimivicinus sp. TaxID=3056640 RepID=UPI003FEE3B05